MGKHKENGRIKPVSELEKATPPVPALEAIQRNLLLAMFDGISEKDVSEIVAKQVEMAKKGDGKAARFIVDMLQTNLSEHKTICMQQALVVNKQEKDPVKLLDLRVSIVQLIAMNGPMSVSAIAESTEVIYGRAKLALAYPWFEEEPDGWHLTAKARAEVLEKEDD